MRHPQPPLLSALLDGELRGWQRWRVQRHLRLCERCATEYKQLEHLRALIRTHSAVPAMGESAESFWSRLKADILRSETTAAAPLPAPRLRWTDWLWLHQSQLMATSAAVALLLLVVGMFLASRPARQLAQRQPMQTPAPIVPLQSPAAAAVKVASATTVLPDTVATVVEQSESQVTVVWISGLPWTATMTEMKTLYGNWDS